MNKQFKQIGKSYQKNGMIQFIIPDVETPAEANPASSNRQSFSNPFKHSLLLKKRYAMSIIDSRLTFLLVALVNKCIVDLYSQP